ncbi:MAG: hypothetical protein DWQ47_13225 [Acidobacteria bacterium]|nr:MAG: hypothetical protein DWQ32_00625 [Acidobacteriota bacterium]REK02960.1 MAG: hypothetical protein DWQ38_11510 [Acidobacteriota bacterium]REK13236.1 MAG: hypothetical protein DWQ43_06315 [Acidobacteriota bacterium]REK41230.1 MAG: hypothetical protein DWQ47_13225 [Acidobacteriota bacterium]
MMMKIYSFTIILCAAFLFAACTSETPDTSDASPEVSEQVSPDQSGIRETEQPDRIMEMLKARGEQDQATPELVVEMPTEGSVIESSTVRVKVKVEGELKGLTMGKDDNGMGNHVHVILDNQPYAAHYNWDEGFELRNVTDGEHTLRMFPSRPWHQSYKNEGAFRMIRFTVRGGGADESKPTTDDKGNTMAEAKAKTEPAEGVEVEESNAGEVDPVKPLLTYSRPKGEYKGEEASAIMVDFWLLNAKLTGDGGEYRIRCTINEDEPFLIEKWAPLWLAGWKSGKNTVKLELIDASGNLVENGGYNSTSRDITVSP